MAHGTPHRFIAHRTRRAAKRDPKQCREVRSSTLLFDLWKPGTCRRTAVPRYSWVTCKRSTAPWCGGRRADGPTGPRRPVPTPSHSREARHARHPRRRGETEYGGGARELLALASRIAIRIRSTKPQNRSAKRKSPARKFRNHLRDMLFLSKGAPSASPFCTWVNGPREPEQLPPDWAPDEPMRQPLPDNPPFRASRGSLNLLRLAISPAIVPE